MLEVDGETVNELALETAKLPADGRQVDAVLTVELADGTVVDLTYEEAETTNHSEAVQQRFNALSQCLPSTEDETD